MLRTATILVIIAVVFTGFALLFSDVFQSKAKDTWSQFSTWTNERIAADPDGYLTYCEQETLAALQGLKGSEIEITQSKYEIQMLGEAAKDNVDTGTKALENARTVYSQAGQWPVVWLSQPRSEEFMKQQIIAFYDQVEGHQSVLEQCNEGIRTLDAQLGSLFGKRSNLTQQLSQIKVNRQLVRIQKITDDLVGKLSAIGGVIQTSIMALKSPDQILSVEDVKSEYTPDAANHKFEKAMAY